MLHVDAAHEHEISVLRIFCILWYIIIFHSSHDAVYTAVYYHTDFTYAELVQNYTDYLR